MHFRKSQISFGPLVGLMRWNVKVIQYFQHNCDTKGLNCKHMCISHQSLPHLPSGAGPWLLITCQRMDRFVHFGFKTAEENMRSYLFSTAWMLPNCKKTTNFINIIRPCIHCVLVSKVMRCYLSLPYPLEWMNGLNRTYHISAGTGDLRWWIICELRINELIKTHLKWVCTNKHNSDRTYLFTCKQYVQLTQHAIFNVLKPELEYISLAQWSSYLYVECLCGNPKMYTEILMDYVHKPAEIRVSLRNSKMSP